MRSENRPAPARLVLMSAMFWLAGSDARALSLADAVFANGFDNPPVIVDVSPSRILNGTCTQSLTVSGTAFSPAATLWYVAPSGTLCAGSSSDANGQLLCPITIDASTDTSITAHLSTCPALGPYPVVAINPGGLASYYYSIEITPSADGHLNTGTFTAVQNQLEAPRWKHAVEFGFDDFLNSIVYVAGGQGAQNQVLGSVEFSRFDQFGTPGVFTHLEQYGNAGAPRIANDLSTPREGSTLVRVGRSLFSIGGNTSRSDTTSVFPASNAAERAEILGKEEMPVLAPPTLVGDAGLPTGTWYYRVSAVGPSGESVAENEVVAVSKAGELQLCWTAPAGAVSYNIYRSLASDGQPQTEAALAYEVPGPCFTDDGVGTHAPAPGHAHASVAAGGALSAGSYSYRISAVAPISGFGTFETYASYVASATIDASDVTSGNQTVQIAWDAVPVAGASYRVYRLDPATNDYFLLTGANSLVATSFNDGGVTFDASNAVPRHEVAPLPAGSLSKWSNAPPLQQAREGLDSVAITLDPAASGGLVARILVAGGRDGSGGTYTYFTSAESLGVYQNGTTDASWAYETSVLTHPRAYYSLVSTENRNTTPFPGHADPGASTEPVYVLAVMGDDAFAATNNGGRSDFEACSVGTVSGHLACGATWFVQTSNDTHTTFGADAILEFSYLYPFYGIATETVGSTSSAITFNLNAIGRYPLLDLSTIVNGQVLSSRQSASTSFVVARAYYQMTRLLSYVYVIGGYAAAHTENGLPVPAGPTGLIEQHQQ